MHEILNLNKSQQERSSSEVKKMFLSRENTRKQLSPFIQRANNDKDLSSFLKPNNNFHKSNISSTKKNIFKVFDELSLSRSDKKNFHYSLEKISSNSVKTNSFVENPSKKSKANSFLENPLKIVKTSSLLGNPKKNSKETFKISLEKSYSFLLEIINKKWDEFDNIDFEDSKEITKGLLVQKERSQKLLLLKDEILEYISKMSLFNESQEIFESIQIVFCEYERIIDLIQKWLQNICSKAKHNQKLLEDKKNKEVFDLHSYYNIVVEILNLILRINQKKESDLDIMFFNEKFEKEWHYKLNELKSKFTCDFPDSNFMNTVKKIEVFYEELFKKIHDLKGEKELLHLDNSNFMKSFDNSNNLILKNTLELLNQRKESQDISFDPKVHYSLEYLRKYEQIYLKAIEELKMKNEIMQKDMDVLNDKIKASAIELTAISKKKSKNVVLLKKNKESQINFFNYEDNQLIKKAKTNIFLRAIQPLNIGFKMSNICIFSFINLILTEKICSDYNDYSEFKPLENLQNFTLRWFLTNFGNQTYTNLLLKDFYANMIEIMNNYERCEVFNNICGLQNNLTQIHTNNKVSNLYYSSPKATLLYIKLVNYVSVFIKIEENPLLSPFFPMNEQITLSYEECVKTLEYLGNGQENDLISTNELLKQFKSAVEKRKIKIIEKKKKKNVFSVLGSKNDESINIFLNLFFSLDILAKFLLDTICYNFEQKIEEIINSLKMIQTNRKTNDFFSEDFTKIMIKQFPKKSKNFVDECFMEFIYNNTQHSISNIKDLIDIVAVKLCDVPYAKSFYLDFQENEPNVYSKEKYFDYASSLIVITNLYEHLREKIKIEEVNNDNLYTFHEQFKKEYMRFPKNMENLNQYNTFFSGNDKKDIMERVDKLWVFFRSMIDILFSKSDMAKTFK